MTPSESLSFIESFSHFRCISTVSNKFLSASSKDPPHSFCSTWGIWLLMEPSVQVPLRLCRNPQFLNNCSNIFFSLVASCFHSLFLSLYLPRYWGSTFSPHLENIFYVFKWEHTVKKGQQSNKRERKQDYLSWKENNKFFSLLLMIIFNLVNDENMVYPKPAFLLTSCLNVIVDPS